MNSLNFYIFISIIYIISNEPTKVTNSGLICTSIKVDCYNDYPGPGSVPQNLCEERDCCFEQIDNNVNRVPWCFHGVKPTTIPTTIITTIPTIACHIKFC